MMKRDPRNLLKEFRALAPARRPIGIQRWSFRRVGMILLTMAIVGITIAIGVELLFPDDRALSEPAPAPACDTNRTLILMAQAVPTADELPCVEFNHLGWRVTRITVGRDRAAFVLGVAEDEAQVVVTVTPECPSNRAPPVTVTEIDGGCVTYSASVPEGAEPVPSFEPEGGLSFLSRARLVEFVESETGLRLCGRGVPCP